MTHLMFDSIRDTTRNFLRSIIRNVTTPTFLLIFAFIVLVIGFYSPFLMVEINETYELEKIAKTPIQGKTDEVPKNEILVEGKTKTLELVKETDKNIQKGKLKDWALLIVVGSAVAGFLFSAGVTLHAHARDRAFNLIQIIPKDKELGAAFKNVGAFFGLNNKGLDESDVIKLYNLQSNNAIKLRGDIILVGNYFEDMALSILYKEINEEMIENSFRGTFVRYYEYIRDNHILEVLRNNPPMNKSPFGKTIRPELFCNLDELYGRWGPRYRRSVDKLLKKDPAQ